MSQNTMKLLPLNTQIRYWLLMCIFREIRELMLCSVHDWVSTVLALCLVKFRSQFCRKRRIWLRKQTHYHVRFEVLIVVTVECGPTLFGNVLLCSLVPVTGNSGKMLHLSSGFNCKPINQAISAVLVKKISRHKMRWTWIYVRKYVEWISVNELFTILLPFIIFCVRSLTCGIPGLVVGHLPAGVQRIERILIMRPELCILTTLSCGWGRYSEFGLSSF
jgi:hypothetical protein